MCEINDLSLSNRTREIFVIFLVPRECFFHVFKKIVNLSLVFVEILLYVL